jgi:cytochrome c oxidase subunit 2
MQVGVAVRIALSALMATSTAFLPAASYSQPTAQKSEDDTKTFLLADLMQRGEKVYINNCVHCHQGRGQGLPAHSPHGGGGVPTLAGSKVANGSKEPHIDTVLNGRPQTAMQPFKHLSNAELAAVITYTRNSWGNKGGEVQPAEVKARRKGK